MLHDEKLLATVESLNFTNAERIEGNTYRVKSADDESFIVKGFTEGEEMEMEHSHSIANALQQHPAIAKFYGVHTCPNNKRLGDQEYKYLHLFEDCGKTPIEDRFYEWSSKRATVAYENVSGTFRSLVDGIRHFHDHGITHHDISGHNVLSAGDTQIKIIDYGQCQQRLFNIPGGEFGTLPYAHRSLCETHTKDTDYHSLGVLAYEAICGNVDDIDEFNALDQQKRQKKLEAGVRDFTGWNEDQRKWAVSFVNQCWKIGNGEATAESLMDEPFIRQQT